MSKIAINNEIVLMRQAVRKARVAVVRKLIKEAKLLQARKHGDEKTIEKCKRKGQRLLAEIEASKKIKDDDITRYGITNTRKLAEVLNDCTSEPATRIMCRLSFHKILADRIAKFKEKFPEYEEHLGPGRKKLSKIQRQANREARNAMKRNPGINAGVETSKNETTNENAAEHSEESGDEEDTIAEDSKEAAESAESDDKVDDDSNITEVAERKINEADGKDSSPGRKKLSKIERRANGKARKATKSKGQGSEEKARRNQTVAEKMVECSDESDNEEAMITEDSKETTEFSSGDGEVEGKINEADEEESEEMEGSRSKRGSEPGSILRIKTPSSADKRGKRKNAAESVMKDSTPITSEKAKDKKSKKDKKTKSIKAVDEETTKQRPSAEAKKPKPIKVISREATVKRFAELADANESEEIVREPEPVGSSKRRSVQIEKEVDSFFMTENGESEYLSVVVPKSKLCEEDEQDERFGQNHAAKRQMNFHERNNKFFSKIDQRSSGGAYGDKRAPNVAGRKRSINFPNREGGPKKFGREGSGGNARADFEKKIEAKEEVLHPSWAARKKQQEILKQGFQGKKIVFDD